MTFREICLLYKTIDQTTTTGHRTHSQPSMDHIQDDCLEIEMEGDDNIIPCYSIKTEAEPPTRNKRLHQFLQNYQTNNNSANITSTTNKLNVKITKVVKPSSNHQPNLKNVKIIRLDEPMKLKVANTIPKLEKDFEQEFYSSNIPSIAPVPNEEPLLFNLLSNPPNTSNISNKRPKRSFKSPEELRNMLNEQMVECSTMHKELLTEIQLLRDEVKGLGGFGEAVKNVLPPMELPKTTTEAFEELDEQVRKIDIYECALIKEFNTITDSSLEKYIRGCLKNLITDDLACKYSWRGYNYKTAVESFMTIKVIKACTMVKFPSALDRDITYILKKWFQYAPDRLRKKAISISKNQRRQEFE